MAMADTELFRTRDRNYRLITLYFLCTFRTIPIQPIKLL